MGRDVVPRAAMTRRHRGSPPGGILREGGDDVICMGSPGGVGRQRCPQQRHEQRVNPVEVDVTRAHPGEHGVHASPAEGWAAGGRKRDRRRPAPPVGGIGDRRALHELRREVAGRAHDEPTHGVAHVVLQVRDAEVDEDRLAVLEQHVAGLDVAVHDPARVDRADRLGDAAREPEQLVRLEKICSSTVSSSAGPGT